MHPNTRYRLSLLMNLMLVLGICCLAAVTLTGGDGTLAASGPYPEDDEHRAYQNSVHNGLTMGYDEYLAKKYPEQNLGQKTGALYLVNVRPVTPEKMAISEISSLIRITDRDFVHHPSLAKLFVADAPFSTVQLTPAEVNDLQIYFAEDVIMEWNGTLYRPFMVSNVILGTLAVLSTGLVVFAGNRREISDEPTSRVAQIQEYIRKNPGCSMQDITRNTGFSRGSVSYNLHRLKAANRVQENIRHGVVRHYAGTNEMNTVEEYLKDILAKEKAAEIFTKILQNPQITQKDLATATGLPVTTVQWHLTRMILDAAVEVKQEKKTTRYTITQEFAKQYQGSEHP